MFENKTILEGYHDQYLAYMGSLSDGELRFSRVITLLWILVFLASLWRYIRARREDDELMNRYAEKLFPDATDYPRMQKGIIRYLFMEMLISLLIIIGTLIFPSLEIHLLSTLFYLYNRKVQKDWYTGRTPTSFLR